MAWLVLIDIQWLLFLLDFDFHSVVNAFEKKMGECYGQVILSLIAL